jgi:hypothetical protein
VGRWWAAKLKRRVGPRGNKTGLRGGFGPEAGKEKGWKRIPFSYFSKELTKIEFKHKFEFKQIKTMQQHVCNSKLL